MVVIRLQRVGKKNNPSYRVVVTDSRTSVRGECIEVIGFYDPIHKNCTIDAGKVDAWKAKGAQISDSVSTLIKRDGKAPAKKAAKPNRKSALRAKMAEEAKAAEIVAKEAEKIAAAAAKAEAEAAPALAEEVAPSEEPATETPATEETPSS